MDYIVFDLEWNQCPGGKERENRKLPFEIIEIGAVRLDENLCEIGHFQERIRPKVYRTLHHHIREVLHTDLKEFRNARSFPDVAASFLEWCSPLSEVIFCTWGSQDLLELQRNLKFYRMTNPFPLPLFYLDIQKSFSLQLDDGKSRQSLSSAVEALKLAVDVPFHEAHSDALYTARIMQRLDREKMLDYFSVDYFRPPSVRKEEILIQYDTYQKFVSRIFPTKTDAMRDRKVASTRCYLCGKPARKKLRWFTGNSKNYYCLASCEEHGFLKGKIRMKKAPDGQVFCVKTLKLISPADAERIARKKELIAKKNQLKTKNPASQ